MDISGVKLIIPKGLESYSHLQLCGLPEKYFKSGLKQGDIVKCRFPEVRMFLCRAIHNSSSDCIIMSDAVAADCGEKGPPQIERVMDTPMEIKTLELDVVLSEDLIEVPVIYEDQDQLRDIIRVICQMLTLADGFNVDLSSYSLVTKCAVTSLVNIKTNTESKLGFVTSGTEVLIRNISFESAHTNSSSSIIGMDDVRASIEKEISDRRSNNYLLLIGPSGAGKTTLAKDIAGRISANIFTLECRVSQVPGENSIINRVEKIVRLAKLSTNPSIVLIEDLEQYCPKKSSDAKRAASEMIYSEMVQSFDLLKKAEKVSVIATTRNVELIDPKFRRPGRIDREIYIRVPNEKKRREIINGLFKDINPCNSPSKQAHLVDLITSCTPAFVGGDLVTLLKTAKRLSTAGEISEVEVRKALLTVKPVSTRTNAYLVERDLSLTLGSLGGLEKLKRTLDMAIFKPLKHPERFLRFGLSLPKGILMYGPPGCAKTTVARCLATEMNRHLIAVSAAQVYSPYVGNSEQLLAQIFHQARMCAPSIIFIDEIDSIVGTRSKNQKGNSDVQTKLLSTLLIEMDGIGLKVQANHNPENHILIIGATNRPDMIDDALMRPGRFDRLIYVPAPNASEREDILRKVTSAMPLEDSIDLKLIAEGTRNFSGADLVNLCNETALEAITRNREATKLTMDDFLSTLGKVKASLTQDQIDWYDNYADNQDDPGVEVIPDS